MKDIIKIDMNNSVMPLYYTIKEINEISDYLLKVNIDNVFEEITHLLSSREIKGVLFIGSGDSYAISLAYEALFNDKLGIVVKTLQSGEFLKENINYLNENWLVVVISASGRKSPVLYALKKAQLTQALVIALTNNHESDFFYHADRPLVIKAEKKGMPTQSSFATALYLDVLLGYLSGYRTLKFNEILNVTKNILDGNNFLSEKMEKIFWNKKITFVGSRENFGIATLFSNLLYCGPQIRSQVFQSEEFHHALRINQMGDDDCIIFLTNEKDKDLELDISQLNDKKSSLIIISNDLINNLFDVKAMNDFQYRYACMISIFRITSFLTMQYLKNGNTRVSLR